jgi:hypothetical protein
MCGGGGGRGGALKSLGEIFVDPSGAHDINKAGPLASPIKPDFRKPPNTDINTELTASAAQHAKDLQALAFGISDTKLTPATGLGSVPKSLLLPKQTLGGS